jgi:diketogulonate reductase-like aldo/keto reductase
MNRREFLRTTPAALGALAAPVLAQPAPRLRRTLPRTQESIPAIGMGTWLTFDVGENQVERAQRREVLQRFFAAGGGVIDSSPMYGRAEHLLGELLPALPHAGKLFTSTKVWTAFDRVGPRQLEESARLWRVPRFDLLLVHNLLNWQAHLKTLRAWKDQGRTRYIGVSTSHGRMHDEIRHVMRTEPLDAIQITYNLADASAEPVLDLAAERGIAVFINRPFDGGLLFNAVGARALPPWAAAFDCANWAQFFLKWIVSHPAVACTIPATTQPAHMDQNMGAGLGRLPEPAERRRMSALIARL